MDVSFASMGWRLTGRDSFAVLTGISVLSGCLFHGNESNGKRKDISAELRASCPENPLLKSISEKRSGASIDSLAGVGMAFRIQACPESDSLRLRLEIYDNDGFPVNDIAMSLSSEVCRTLPKDSLGNPAVRNFWDLRNADHKAVSSGYYFQFLSSENATLSGTTSRCVFVLLERDVAEPI